jgi:hypothetical protein
MRAYVPDAAGNFSSSSSCACWDSVPGTVNLSFVSPPVAIAAPITAASTTAHRATTLLRRSNAHAPSRYSCVAIVCRSSIRCAMAASFPGRGHPDIGTAP